MKIAGIALAVVGAVLVFGGCMGLGGIDPYDSSPERRAAENTAFMMIFAGWIVICVGGAIVALARKLDNLAKKE